MPTKKLAKVIQNTLRFIMERETMMGELRKAKKGFNTGLIDCQIHEERPNNDLRTNDRPNNCTHSGQSRSKTRVVSKMRYMNLLS